MIREATSRNLIQPAARIRGDSLRGPLRGRRDQRLLNRVLGIGEIAVTTGERAEHLRREVAQQVSDTGGYGQASFGGPLITSRTSMGMPMGAPPGPGAVEIFAASS